MISVVIPTLDAEHGLARTLAALVSAAVEGLVREVIVADGGSTDGTIDIADGAGATIVRAARGRGVQLRAGAEAARQPWLLFLHADTILSPGWERETWAFIEQQMNGARPCAAAYRFALDDLGFAPRMLEFGVALRGSLFAMPYGDQGLLIPTQLYREIGGYQPMALMEDVDIVRRLGRRRLRILRAEAVTSATRYRHDGYAHRVARNIACLALYFAGAPNGKIAKFYNGSEPS